MKVLLSICLVLFPLSGFAFDVSCFREKAHIESTQTGIIAIGVKNVDDQVFFVSGKDLLATQVDTTEKNPPILYTSSGLSDIRLLQDFDPMTAIEVDPLELSQRDVFYTFDLGKTYPKNTLDITLGVHSYSPYRVELSEDGVSFFRTNSDSITVFSFRFLRVIFPKQQTQSDITRFHTLNIFQRIQTRFLVDSPGGSIDIYRPSLCSGIKAPSSLSLASDKAMGETLVAEFIPNPLYKNDTDEDGRENMQDNCPKISNPDQKDRNRDGVGDACSDDDTDGIFGMSDNCPTVQNPDQADKNVNLLGDACEFDSDQDGVPDGVDNAIHTKNPHQEDSDRDRIGDVIDNCNLYNPDQLDFDKNGRGDVCDRDEEYRKQHDSDGDGVLDFSDNCPKNSNPDQKDSDNDRIGDVCDNCALLQNPDQKDDDKNMKGDACEDADTDGVEGWRDNCPKNSNPDQKDSDNDRIGDVCEDTDGDGIFDGSDICPAVYDPDQKDTDKDGIGNLCDNQDNRPLESNRTLFMIIFGSISLLFIGVIVYFMRKIF